MVKTSVTIRNHAKNRIIADPSSLPLGLELHHMDFQTQGRAQDKRDRVAVNERDRKGRVVFNRASAVGARPMLQIDEDQ